MRKLKYINLNFHGYQYSFLIFLRTLFHIKTRNIRVQAHFYLLKNEKDGDFRRKNFPLSSLKARKNARMKT